MHVAVAPPNAQTSNNGSDNAFWCIAIGVVRDVARRSHSLQRTRQSVARATQPRLAAERLASEGELDLGEVTRRSVRLALCGAERGEHLEQLHNVAVVAQVRRGARRLAAHLCGLCMCMRMCVRRCVCMCMCMHMHVRLGGVQLRV